MTTDRQAQVVAAWRAGAKVSNIVRDMGIPREEIYDILDDAGELAFRSHQRRRGRPAVGPVVEVRLSTDVLKRVDAGCEQFEMTRSALIRRLVEQAVNDMNWPNSWP